MKKRIKKYFRYEDSKSCYPLEFFNGVMLLDKKNSMYVFEAIPSRVKGKFRCKLLCFNANDSSNYCGVKCYGYQSFNGINGRCKHHSPILYIVGNKVKIERI